MKYMAISLSGVTGQKPMEVEFKGSELLVCNRTAVGIEVELENFANASLQGKNGKLSYWQSTHDGSLKHNGIELIGCVSAGSNIYLPLVGENVVKGLEELKEVFELNEKHGYVPELSERTSVHVHIDVRDMSAEELHRMLLLYLVFEIPLFKFAGEHRKNNAYCIPLAQNKMLLGRLDHLRGESPSGILTTINQGTKYDAANIYSVRQKGSVEFRMHEGCTDTGRLLNWINLLLSLKVAAKTLTTWTSVQLPNYFSAVGSDEFMLQVFSPDLYRILKYEGIEYDVLKGIRFCQDVLLDKLLSQYTSEHALSQTSSYKGKQEDLIVYKFCSTKRSFNPEAF